MFTRGKALGPRRIPEAEDALLAAKVTAAELRQHLGLEDDTVGNATATRLLNVCKGLVERYAPYAPDDVHNEALLPTAAYLHAGDPSLRVLRSVKVLDALEVEPRAPDSAVRLSGAAALMSPWRVRRAVRAEGVEG